MTVRRVVTGAAEAGPARFVGDGPVEPVRFSSSGHSYYQLWGADEPSRLPDAGARPPQAGLLPPPGGYRFGIFVVAAAVNADADPGMHATDSIDLVLVLEGSVEVELDSGETRILTTGDTLVQNGSAHRWVNKGDIEARLAVFTVGACRDEAAGA
jgi:quercetin dioxygenase-like cupin family protein